MAPRILAEKTAREASEDYERRRLAWLKNYEVLESEEDEDRCDEPSETALVIIP